MSRRGEEALVEVWEGEIRIGELVHLVQHSPDGFEWGYSGSGPSDLARSIVGDLIEVADPNPADYQRVKVELVATLPKQGGEITGEQVLDVLFARLDEL